jgi:hypothetical protein
MQLAFITSIKIENQSGQDVWFTPIGTVGIEGRKRQLPIYITAFPAFPAVKTRRFHLKNGQTIKIKYDWDDINFSEIAIESKAGQFYELVVDPHPTENQYHPPKSKQFIIPVLESLLAIQPNVYEAVVESNDRWRQVVVFVGSFVIWVMFFRMLRQYRKDKSVDPKIVNKSRCEI